MCVRNRGADHGVRVFEQGETEIPCRGFVLGRQFAFILRAFVKITVALVAQRGRTALHSINFYVLTAWNIFQTHFFSP